jgi:DNA-directed RNA polymerase alpha subunit
MFLLRHRDGMSYAKIGEKYGVTMDTALRTIQRIQRKLRHPSKSRVLFFGEEACRKERAEENAEWIRLYNEQIDPLQNASPSPDADISIEDMYLSTRSFNCLSRAGVKTVKDIIRYGSLINVRNLGSTGIEEIQYKLDCILEALPQLRNI